jgi:hypothetical protein
LFLLLTQPKFELIAISALYGLQIINTLYILSDFYLTDIQGDDRIGAFFIILSLVVSFIAGTILIGGVISLNTQTNASPTEIPVTPQMAFALYGYEVSFILNYLVIAILCIIYFLSLPFRIPTNKVTAYTNMEAVALFAKFIFSVATIGLSGGMLYFANLFAMFVNTPIIRV